MLPRCDYWRAVAYTRRKQFDEAAECLGPVLAGSDSPHASAHRQMILLAAWQFALSHPEMARRVGWPQLQRSGRRLEAIAAVERQLHKEPEDTATWDLKRVLYNDVTEAEYHDAVPPGQTAEFFDHEYCKELGLALIGDEARWERGAEYLRLAARGLPQLGPSLLVQIARASEKAKNYKGAWHHYELAKESGKAVGAPNLSAEDKKIYFQVVKMLADSRMEDNDIEAALENYKLYTEFEGVGWETYRNLAELYERKKDAWSALHATEHALTYNASDKDLQERKDKYYYSITPEQLRERLESVYKWFDADYCIRKARQLLDRQGGDLDLIDWANHLAELAYVARPSSIVVQLLRARVRRLRGDTAEAMQALEDIRTNKPEKFPSGEEEENWYAACKMLGDLYLNEKPDLALECFQEFRKSPKSGADTMYKMGVAYEKLGDLALAARCYEQVTAYESHPLYSASVEALRRVRAGGVPSRS
jgi:tetratricopeptide (TPR) repeat protein